MEKSQSLGDRLKALRAERPGLSVQEVADAVGISRPYLSGIENGHDNPGYESFVALADYYRVSLDFLSGRELAISSDGKRLLDAFERLPKDDRDFMITIIEAKVGSSGSRDGDGDGQVPDIVIVRRSRRT
jgi:transcriptional regulator with XRE-family HTH domain